MITRRQALKTTAAWPLLHARLFPSLQYCHRPSSAGWAAQPRLAPFNAASLTLSSRRRWSRTLTRRHDGKFTMTNITPLYVTNLNKALGGGPPDLSTKPV